MANGNGNGNGADRLALSSKYAALTRAVVQSVVVNLVAVICSVALKKWGVDLASYGLSQEVLVQMGVGIALVLMARGGFYSVTTAMEDSAAKHLEAKKVELEIVKTRGEFKVPELPPPEPGTPGGVPLKIALAFALLLPLAGCGVDKVYVQADRDTFDAIAPEYMKYVREDARLDPAQKDRRERTVQAWERRSREAGGAVK